MSWILAWNTYSTYWVSPKRTLILSSYKDRVSSLLTLLSTSQLISYVTRNRFHHILVILFCSFTLWKCLLLYHLFLFIVVLSISGSHITCSRGKYKDLKIETNKIKTGIFFWMRTETYILLLGPQITPFHKQTSLGYSQYFMIITCLMQLIVDHHHF